MALLLSLLFHRSHYFWHRTCKGIFMHRLVLNSTNYGLHACCIVSPAAPRATHMHLFPTTCAVLRCACSGKGACEAVVDLAVQEMQKGCVCIRPYGGKNCEIAFPNPRVCVLPIFFSLMVPRGPVLLLLAYFCMLVCLQ